MTTPMNAFSPNYSVKTVETRDEYFASLRLLHDCYVQKGLMNRDPRGIRLRIHHLLPESNILICKYKNEVVGTCTLVHRGRIPYPVQSSFPKETADALNISDSVVEISALAVHPDYRQKGNMIQLLMTKYLIQLLNLMYANPYVICSVHPKAEDFYKIFFSFHRAGDLIEYAYAGGAPGIFMSGIVSTEHFETYRESFRGDSAKTNIMDFQLASDSRLKLPNLSRELLFDSNYLNSLLRDIIPELLDDRKHLAEHKLHVIGELLKLMPDQNVRLLHAYNKPCYPYRLRTHLNPEQMPGSNAVWPLASKIASAIGKSKWVPSFGTSAGARFTLTRVGG
jgi:hypothetical protein